MKLYRFTKTGREWFIYLPEYIEQGGSPGDLQMVDGADAMLDAMAGDKEAVSIWVSSEKFDDADLLTLTQKCDPYIGGGYYLMKTYEGKEINRSMWLCQVTAFVFGDIPPEIYVKKEKSGFMQGLH